MSWTSGYTLVDLPLPPEARELALAEEWAELDALMRTAVEEQVKPLLRSFRAFASIEHMLALRDGDNPDEEDGIWHDDSSRQLAFSWSLNFWGLPEGGTLGIRPFGGDSTELGPYPPGTLIVFHTGVDGFEHRTARVRKGRRLVCAGWCS